MANRNARIIGLALCLFSASLMFWVFVEVLAAASDIMSKLGLGG